MFLDYRVNTNLSQVYVDYVSGSLGPRPFKRMLHSFKIVFKLWTYIGKVTKCLIWKYRYSIKCEQLKEEKNLSEALKFEELVD